MARPSRARSQASVFMASAGAIVVLLLGLFVFRTAVPPGAKEMLEQALQGLEEAAEYDLAIVETAPGYTLYFQGRVGEDGVLTGELGDYDLEVLCNTRSLYVRQSGEEEWEEAKAMELQDLRSFLVGPAEILAGQRECFDQAVTGEAVELSGATCRTVYLELSRFAVIAGLLFPEVSLDTVQSITLGAALTEQEYRLKQLKVIVQFDQPGKERLERAYYLDYAT